MTIQSGWRQTLTREMTQGWLRLVVIMSSSLKCWYLRTEFSFLKRWLNNFTDTGSPPLFHVYNEQYYIWYILLHGQKVPDSWPGKSQLPCSPQTYYSLATPLQKRMRQLFHHACNVPLPSLLQRTDKCTNANIYIYTFQRLTWQRNLALFHQLKLLVYVYCI